MELEMGPYQISGGIEGDRYTGVVRPEQFDVSIPYRRDRSSSDTRTAFISAKRV